MAAILCNAPPLVFQPPLLIIIAQSLKQEVVHSKVTFTADSYRVEKIIPCPDEQHDIVDAEQPVEMYFEDGVKIIQDRYCRKCGQHFFSEGERKDEL